VEMPLFFPHLVRRSNYSKHSDGSFLAYSSYRQEIREDCKCKCVYCDIFENENGGEENMNLDHFRPKKIDKFKHLVNNPINLMWTCRGCNLLKSDKWPALDIDDTYLNQEGFIDPFQVEYSDFFEVDEDGVIIPLKDPSAYMIAVLHLNRETRRKLRELRIKRRSLMDYCENEITKINGKRKRVEDDKLLSFEHKKEWLNDLQSMENNIYQIKKLLSPYI